MSAGKELSVTVVTPTDKLGPIDCASVKFVIKDGRKRNEGGLYGIRSGHANAVFALDEGDVVAEGRKGEPALKCRIAGGFATVEKDTVIIAAREIISAGSA